MCYLVLHKSPHDLWLSYRIWWWWWCKAKRDVGADVAVTEVSLFAVCAARTPGKFRRKCLSLFSDSEFRKHNTYPNFFQMKRWGKTVMDSMRSNILLHFLLSHHLRVNQCGMVQRMKPIQAAWNVGSSLGYFQYTELTYRHLFSNSVMKTPG